MNFILSVLGSNLFIVFAGFAYIWVGIFLFKFWNLSKWSHWPEDVQTSATLGSIFWPIVLPFYIVAKLLIWVVPVLYRLIEKTVPNITFSNKE